MAAETNGVVVPVQDSVTLRQTVDYAIQQLREADETPPIHFVFLATWRGEDPGTDARRTAADELLEQVSVWARYDCEDAGLDPESVDISTAVLGTSDYLFSPTDYADILSAYAADHGLDRVLVDPEYSLVGQTTLVEPLEYELREAGFRVDEAPVERPASRTRFVGSTNRARFLALFGTSFVFYQILGGFAGLFDIVTGAVTALVVAISLSSISFYRDPSLTESPKRLARSLIYLPYLIYEIILSNLAVARVILDPELPIDPRMTRVRVFVGSGFPLTSLCNSITLTPGTLTVKADDQELYVHSLLPFAREGLVDGSLERWIRFVFYGREAARFPTPRERGDTEVLQQPAATDGGQDVDGDSDRLDDSTAADGDGGVDE